MPMISLSNIRSLAPHQNQVKVHKASGGTIGDMVSIIKKMSSPALSQVRKYKEQFCGANEIDTARNIWNFLHNQIRYKADGMDSALIKLPNSLIQTGEGDCKSMALFAHAMLNACGIANHYVLAYYNPEQMNQAHIYVQTNSGIIVDPVYNQFNAEAPAYKKTKIMTRVATLSGHQNSAVGAIGVGFFVTVVRGILKGDFSGGINEIMKKVEEGDMKSLRKIHNWALGNGGSYLGAKRLIVLIFRFIRFGIAVAFRENFKGIGTAYTSLKYGKNLPSSYKKAKARVDLIYYTLGGDINYLGGQAGVGSKKQPLKLENVKEFVAKFLPFKFNESGQLVKKDTNQLYRGQLEFLWKKSKVAGFSGSRMNGAPPGPGEVAAATGGTVAAIVIIIEALTPVIEAIADGREDNTTDEDIVIQPDPGSGAPTTTNNSGGGGITKLLLPAAAIFALTS